MKKNTLILVSLFFSFTLFSQKTHHIDLSSRAIKNLSWGIGIGTNNDATINVGDTVIWTWTDNVITHTVTSTGGTESFDSGAITGLGMTYQFTFNTVGITTYNCSLHPGTMQGTINVQVLSIEDEIKNECLFGTNYKKHKYSR